MMISFSFDRFDILGVVKDDVFLRGDLCPQNGPIEECVLIVGRELLKWALDRWIDDKQRFCKNWGHFCGAMGSLCATRSEELAEEDRCPLLQREELDEDSVPTFIPTRTFRIFEFDRDTDMEHG